MFQCAYVINTRLFYIQMLYIVFMNNIIRLLFDCILRKARDQTKVATEDDVL